MQIQRIIQIVIKFSKLYLDEIADKFNELQLKRDYHAQT
jgi:hypothetical protein